MRFGLENLRNLQAVITELANGLTKLSFSDNFSGWEETLVFTAGGTQDIKSRLNFIPSRFIIVYQTGAGQVTAELDGSGIPKIWTKNHLYLINNGAAAVTAKIQFLK